MTPRGLGLRYTGGAPLHQEARNTALVIRLGVASEGLWLHTWGEWEAPTPELLGTCTEELRVHHFVASLSSTADDEDAKVHAPPDTLGSGLVGMERYWASWPATEGLLVVMQTSPMRGSQRDVLGAATLIDREAARHTAGSQRSGIAFVRSAFTKLVMTLVSWWRPY